MPKPELAFKLSSCFALLLVLTLSACGDSATPASGNSASNDDEPRYAGFGPYDVGVTTVALQDREVEVWYPADSEDVAGLETTGYRSFEVLPQAIIDILPDHLNLFVEMNAYAGVPISDAGPFGVFTFSHGAGGFRHAYSGFLSRIASHGFVTVSIDHLEWGLLEQVGLRDDDAADRETEDVLQETLDRLAAASGDAASVLSGGVDVSRVATAGHSAGGRAAFGIPEHSAVKAMIGYATGSARGIETDKSILLYVGSEDGGAARLEEAYDGLSPVKRFVSVEAAGHNSFTDQCRIIHGGNNFLEDLVEAGFPIPENLLSLAIDGCLPENLAPTTFWDVTTHFTVAVVREAFGEDATPVGLGDGVATAFPGVSLTYRHDS